MITFFSIPLPFSGQTGILQKNAITSWLNLLRSCEGILFGDEEGVDSFAEKKKCNFV